MSGRRPRRIALLCVLAQKCLRKKSAVLELGPAMNTRPLTPREKQLLRRLAAGKTDAQIAERIGGRVKRISEQRARLVES
jgi:DNA-binding CsgD family transcriptional regulator